MTTLRSRLIRLAHQNPELRPVLIPLLREGAEGPPPQTTDIYPAKIDHGYDEPLSGGTDVMRRLQNQLRREQGTEMRPTSPEIPKVAGIHPTGSPLWSAFYALHDGVRGFTHVAGPDPHRKADPELEGLAKRLVSLEDRIFKYIKQNYSD